MKDKKKKKETNSRLTLHCVQLTKKEILCHGEYFNASLNIYVWSLCFICVHMCVMFQEINFHCLFLLSLLIISCLYVEAFTYKKKSTWSCCLPMEFPLNWKSLALNGRICFADYLSFQYTKKDILSVYFLGSYLRKKTVQFCFYRD